MQDDAWLVVRRAELKLPLDPEDFEEADQDGWCESIHIQGGHGMSANGGTIGMEDANLAAVGEPSEDEEEYGYPIAAPHSRQYDGPVTFNGRAIDPRTDPKVVHEIGDLDKPFPHDDMDVRRTPRDPDTRKYLWAVLDAREDRDHHNDSRRRKIDTHKGPGRERGRELIRTMRERGDIAA